MSFPVRPNDALLKELKFGSFEWWPTQQKFVLLTKIEGEPQYLVLNKTYAFAFMRFFMRIAQKGFMKYAKKKQMVQKKIEGQPPVQG